MTKATKKTGSSGEALAANFLSDKGYKIIAQNYRWVRGEIDIIAEKENMLVFVEVKTARSRNFGAPETWVTRRKQKQVGMVASRYLQENEIVDMDCRFDVIAINAIGKDWQIKHIENAFWL